MPTNKELSQSPSNENLLTKSDQLEILVSVERNRGQERKSWYSQVIYKKSLKKEQHKNNNTFSVHFMPLEFNTVTNNVLKYFRIQNNNVYGFSNFEKFIQS